MSRESVIHPVWKLPVHAWIVFVALSALLIFIFYAGIKFLLQLWEAPEYGYAYIIPLISLFLIWQRKDQLQNISFSGSWSGLVIVVLGVGILFLGELSALHILIQYALLVVIFGLALSFTGIHGFRKIMVPILLLAFIIPLPGFIYEGLSGQLQLISSRIGVWTIRLFDISVYLEGNIIDLGNFKLQVVEACSGLRYLFPLMTLGFIAAYFFNAPFWMRSVVFLSTIPITVLMNSFRIGMIGVLVEYWGNAMAEGFLHDFEGWVIFMACTAVLVIEMWLLTTFSKDKKPLREVFGIDLPDPTPKDAEVRYRTIPAPFLAALILLALTGVAAATLPHRTEVALQRMDLDEFPMKVGDWVGKQERFEPIVIDALNFDDYLIANYSRGQTDYLNFYIGYYSTQRADKVPHSPRACIPGGGWAITSLTQQAIGGVVIDGVPLKISRLIIQKGDQKQLVYYWFQQRGRVLNNEYLTKWYLFWDALRLNRTDGALVRLTTTIPPGQDLDIADARLRNFAGQVASLLNTYIPGKK